MERVNGDDIRQSINKKINKVLYKNGESEPRGYVCVICDEFVNGNKVERIPIATIVKNSELLVPMEWNETHIDVEEFYKVEPWELPDGLSCLEIDMMQKMLLSPRASYLTALDKRKKDGFSCCSFCKNSLSKNCMPKFAIANNYCFGEPPSCLTALSEVELALLTPVKTYGYCFSYTGGKHKQLKGSLSYYKVDMSSITRTIAHFDVLGLNNNIVVLLYGRLTKEQHAKARERCKIRTHLVLEALKWLLQHNVEWMARNISFENIKQHMTDPCVIDNSLEVESDENNSEIESNEVFNVYFPDGSMSSVTGGQESMEKFNELVQTASLNGYDIVMRANLMKEAVQDFRDNNLVNACLLQFPYGRGGMHEERMNEKKMITQTTDIEEYVKHLAKISQPHFHHELFILILYNLLIKQRMVKTAGWRVRNKCDAHALSHELTMDAITNAISNKEKVGQKRKFNDGGSCLLNAVDAIARAVPHTNEAARQARGSGECLQHHFGVPSFFLTVTPDDDNCFAIQVMSNCKVDDDKISEDLSDSELLAKAIQRTNLRLKFPGICALYFEYVLEIIIEEVIGWDLKKGKARKDLAGLFGTPIAFTHSVEEQGRGTLHCHMQIWIEGFDVIRNALHSGTRSEQREAQKEIVKMVDSVSSCLMFFKEKDVAHHSRTVCKAFEHPCNVRGSKRCCPAIVDDQELRNLRQQRGNENIVAKCPNCEHEWTGDELVESYLICQKIVPGLTKFPDGECRRLKSMAVEYQKEHNVEARINESIIDAGYNHHMHTKSCFQQYNKGGESKGNSGEKKIAVECRYRYPQRPQKKTVIGNATNDAVPWFLWDGSKEDRHIKEVRLKRGLYDVFQNTSCPAISYSNLTCNTNLTVVMPGPVAFYCFKYNMKGTQEDDTKEYGFVKDAIQRVLSKLRRFERDVSEAIKRVLAASFAHQKTNIIGSPLAGYLIRNDIRFGFSHLMIWCPLRDLEHLLEGKDAITTIISNGNIPFFQCVALHYLCRPSALEDISAYEFYSKYEVVRATNRNRKELLEFCNTEYFQHPSYTQKKGLFLQGVKTREVIRLVRILQYDFPDTAEFGRSIIGHKGIGNEAMEKFCKLAMLLFIPFRSFEDLDHRGSFTETFQWCMRNNVLHGFALQFLQNVQDTKSNCCRITGLEDDLQRATKLENQFSYDVDEINYEDVDESHEVINAEDFLNLLDEEEEEEDDGGETFNELPNSFNLGSLRAKGANGCGYSCVANMNTTENNLKTPLIEYEEFNSGIAFENDSVEIEHEQIKQTIPSQHDLVSVLLTKTRRKRQSFEEITGRKKIVRVLEPNGSVQSIVDWAKKARLDAGQRRAFEIFISTYLLTFYVNQPHEMRIAQDRRPYISQRRHLRKLAETEKRGSEQLICFLHGPGGSGKTTVIDLVMKYAQEYSSFLPDFYFDRRTITVTAMTGVAATIIMGDTTHSALYLNQKRPLEAEQIEIWAGTRLVIIDEISFASKQDFMEFHKKLRRLKQQIHLKYGGVSIIFSGDMRQLEPVGAFKLPIYKENCAEFKDWVNCYIELKGMHRFKNDKEWGEILLRFRNGEVTEEDIRKVNERVVAKNCILPENIRYATFFNRDRDSINTALFEERCKTMYNRDGSCDDSLMIFSSNVHVQESSKVFTPFRHVKKFWETCGEDSVKLGKGQGRMDPVLKLYSGCRVMLPCNINVSAGKANGTQATIENIVLKHGVLPKKVLLSNNIPVDAVQASDVAYLSVRHSNARIQPALFTVSPKQHVFHAKFLKPQCLQVKGDDTEQLKLKAIQVPLLVNNATTGHKLQGAGVECLFVHNWSYVTNWVYVMLSRVRTRSGLYCRKPIERDVRKYAVPEELTKMIKEFSARSPTYWSEEEYNNIFDL